MKYGKYIFRLSRIKVKVTIKNLYKIIDILKNKNDGKYSYKSTKHMNIRYFIVCQINQGGLEVKYHPTKDMQGKLFIKF